MVANIKDTNIMEIPDLLETIKLGETIKVEFKEAIRSTDQLSAEMVAFTNSLGGMMIIGVDDNGKIKGLANQQVKKHQDLAMNVAASNTNAPLGSVWTEVAKVDEKYVLLCSYAIDLLPYRGIGSGVLNSLKVHPHIDFENNMQGDFFKVTIHRPIT